jgi:hypothetical protein
MAVTTLTYSAAQTMTVTNLHSLASSTTSAWESACVDNSSDKALDALVMVTLDYANTAPANDKAAYLYAYGGIEATSGPLTNNNNGALDGTESTETLTDFTTTADALKLLGALPYGTTNEVVSYGPFSVALAFGGVLPPYWGLVIRNYSGAALAASGNVIKYVRVTATTA